MNDTTFMLLTIHHIKLTLKYVKRSRPQSKAVHVNDHTLQYLPSIRLMPTQILHKLRIWCVRVCCYLFISCIDLS